MNDPTRIIIEYKDGTRRDVAFGALSGQSQAELAALASGQTAPAAAGQGYILLQWKGGWQEVVAVDGRASDVLRYYTIERVEEIGRLSLDVADTYPQLFEVKRLPGKVDSILFVNGNRLQAYSLEEKATVKEGGKTEHVLYDSKRPNFKMEDDSAASVRYGAILTSLKAELEKRGKSPEALLAAGDPGSGQLYRELAQSLGLRAMERQQDVNGFLRVAAEKLLNQQ